MTLTAEQEREIDARVDRVRRAAREGRKEASVTPIVDAYDLRESKKDQLKGRAQREPDLFRAVMESHGFVWFEPQQLNYFIGPQKMIPRTFEGLVDAYGRPIENDEVYAYKPHTAGQWRRQRPMPMAFTIEDLFSMYETPEDFDRWIRNVEIKRRLAAMGIVVTH